MTDGGMYYTEDGKEMKRFCTYDGVGIEMLQKEGIKTGILTGENTQIVAMRAQKLHMDYLYMGVGSFHANAKTKRQIAEELCQQLHIDLGQVAYVGDDLNDIDLLEAVGYAFCPPNAVAEVRRLPGVRVLNTQGGKGAIREVAEWICKL